MRRKRSSEASSRCARGSTRILVETRTAKDGFSAETLCRARVKEETFGAREGTRRGRPPSDARAAEAGESLLASTREAHSGSSAVAGVFRQKIGDPGRRQIAKPTPAGPPVKIPVTSRAHRSDVRSRSEGVAVKISQSATSVPLEFQARPRARVSRTTVTPHRTIARASLDSSAPWRRVRRWVSRPARCVRRWRCRHRWSPHHRAADPFHGRCVSPALYGPRSLHRADPAFGLAAPRARRVGRIP